ncbi:MAG: phosphotransferase enzyme family protein [Bacillota bacterium]
MNLKNILSHWSIADLADHETIKENAIKIICEDGRNYFLKERPSVDRIHTEEALLKHLQGHGIPTMPPIRTKEGLPYLSLEGKHYCLYPYLEGEHLTYETFEETKEAVKHYGGVLGRLHKALNSYEGRSDAIQSMDMVGEVFDFAVPIMKEDNDPKLKSILDELGRNLKDTYKPLKKQYIHRDFHGQNILFKDSQCTGLIDFDLCVKGYRIFDIAYLLTSILSSDFNDQTFRDHWLYLIPLMLESYEEENRLEENEKQALWHTFLSIQLLFVAYFTREGLNALVKQNLEMLYWLYNHDKAIFEMANIETA